MFLRLFVWICALFLVSGLAEAQLPVAVLHLPVQPRQMILVVTKDWQTVGGQLQRFELNDSLWQPVGPPISVVVGKNGMAWGRGLHPMPQPGSQKKEGDGKSPAGFFPLLYAFGSAPAENVPGIKMAYVQCTRSLECVDDPKSPHYNQILDRPSGAKPDWNSSEKMLMTNGQYRLGIVVGHNTSPPVPGDGSCIFVHIWLGPGIGTTGCTAMADGDIETLLGWIDSRANPVLVQLPQAEYLRLHKAWRLPDMPGLLPTHLGDQ